MADKTYLGWLADAPFMPHGHCFFWDPFILAMHVVADTIIAFSYYSIPVALVLIARNRTNVISHRLFVLFALFIVACGTTHIMEIWNIWNASYFASGIVKILTALFSIATAFILWRSLPKMILAPSNESLVSLVERLGVEVEARRKAQEEVISANKNLSTLVKEAQSKQSAALKQLTFLADHLPQIVWVGSKDGKYEYFNKQWEKYSGSAFNPSDPTTFIDAIHPDDKERVRSAWELAVSTGDSFVASLRLKDGNGAYREFVTRAEPLRDERGAIVRWFGIITESV